MTHLPSLRASGTFAATLATFAILAAMLAGTAQASHACAPPKYPGNGYFTSLKVSKASCSTGRKVALAWYHCRLKHGVAGRCKEHVLGFRCHETRNTIPTEFDARVTCHRRTATVIHTYQQDT